MCLVRGRIFGSLASSKAPLLSSNTVQWTFGGKNFTRRPCSVASFNMPIKGITSLKLVERAIYSASVVDSAVMVCILDAQGIGAPAKQMSHLDRDFDVIGSICMSLLSQFPAKSASTQHSKRRSSLGCITNLTGFYPWLTANPPGFMPQNTPTRWV